MTASADSCKRDNDHVGARGAERRRRAARGGGGHGGSCHGSRCGTATITVRDRSRLALVTREAAASFRRKGRNATAGKPFRRRADRGLLLPLPPLDGASDSSCHAARAASASSLRRSIGFVTPAAVSAESSKRPAISATLVTPACSSSGSRCARPERTRNCAGGRPAVDKGEWWASLGGLPRAGWVHPHWQAMSGARMDTARNCWGNS